MASSISSAGGSTWVLLAPNENPPYLNSFTHILFFKLWKKQSGNVLNDYWTISFHVYRQSGHTFSQWSVHRSSLNSLRCFVLSGSGGSQFHSYLSEEVAVHLHQQGILGASSFCHYSCTRKQAMGCPWSSLSMWKCPSRFLPLLVKTIPHRPLYREHH